MKYKKILFRILILLGIFLVGISIYIFHVRTSGIKLLNNTLTELKTKGYLQDLEDLLPNQLPDSENFYIDIAAAHDKLIALDNDPEWNKLFQEINLKHKLDFNESKPNIIEKHWKEVDDIISELTKNLGKSGIQIIRADKISDKQPSEILYSFDLQYALIGGIPVLLDSMKKLSFLNRICVMQNNKETSRQILKIMQKICSSYNETAHVLINRFVLMHMQYDYFISINEVIAKFPDIDFNTIFTFDEKRDQDLWIKSLIFELSINYHTTKDITNYRVQEQSKQINIPLFTSFAISYNSITNWIDLGHRLAGALKAGLDNIESIKQDNWFPGNLYKKCSPNDIYEILSVQLSLANINFKSIISTQRLIKTAIAILNYQNKYKGYPETLDKLLPEFLNELPKCALTKKDFIYENDGASKTLRGFEEDFENRTAEEINFIPAKRFIIKFPD
ncbi:MAG: hypothetical protein HY606_02135 [Planctomycetes bacterium]|nr:hypothetical protein [Planctomycetota bacterium]